jgi:hypothetical protein
LLLSWFNSVTRLTGKDAYVFAAATCLEKIGISITHNNCLMTREFSAREPDVAEHKLFAKIAEGYEALEYFFAKKFITLLRSHI